MEAGKINPNVSTAPVFKSSVTAAMPTSPVVFGGNGPRFAADNNSEKRTGPSGLWNLIKRTANRLIGKGHQSEDKKLAQEPAWKLEEDRRLLNDKYKKAAEGLKRIIAEQQAQEKFLEEAVEKELEEEREALSAKKYLDSLTEKGLKAGNEDFDAASEQYQRELLEWTQAEKARQEKEQDLEKYRSEAEIARGQWEELKQQLEAANAAIDEDIALSEKAKQNEEFNAVTQSVQEALGEGLTLPGSTQALRQEIRRRYETSLIDDSGANREQRLAQLRAKQGAKALEKQEQIESAAKRLEAKLKEKQSDNQ